MHGCCLLLGYLSVDGEGAHVPIHEVDVDEAPLAIGDNDLAIYHLHRRKLRLFQNYVGLIDAVLQTYYAAT